MSQGLLNEYTDCIETSQLKHPVFLLKSTEKLKAKRKLQNFDDILHRKCLHTTKQRLKNILCSLNAINYTVLAC